MVEKDQRNLECVRRGHLDLCRTRASTWLLQHKWPFGLIPSYQICTWCPWGSCLQHCVLPVWPCPCPGAGWIWRWWEARRSLPRSRRYLGRPGWCPHLSGRGTWPCDPCFPSDSVSCTSTTLHGLPHGLAQSDAAASPPPFFFFFPFFFFLTPQRSWKLKATWIPPTSCLYTGRFWTVGFKQYSN